MALTAGNMESNGPATLMQKRTATEEALAKICAEALRVPDVETDANFFDLGGDSLKAMEVVARVGEVFGVELPLMAFFEDPTVTHLAAVVDELKPAGTPNAMERAAERHEFPLSYSQEVFWLLEQQNSGTGLYNTARIFRVRGEVDASVMERSLNELVRRHEILRVQFVHKANGPVQVVTEPAPLSLALSDLRAINSASAEKAGFQLARETVSEPFDLSVGPALRARLVRLSDEDYLLCISIHHAISDGFTGSILLEELGAIYDSLAAGERVSLPEPELHFTDFAVWEREWMSGTRLETELDYWRSALAGAPPALDLPADFTPASESDRKGRQQAVTISGESLERLRALAQFNGTTLFTVLSAAMRILLYRWSGQADFLIGTIASNRSRTGTERMLGCFVNPLAVRNPVLSGQSTIDLLNNEKRSVMNAFAHQDCPFTAIVEAINPERTGKDNPLFNVAMLLQNFPAIVSSGRHFEAEHAGFDGQVALLDLRLVATEKAGALEVECEYSTALFADGTIASLLAAYRQVLEQLVHAPDTIVEDIVIPDDLLKAGAEYRRARHKRTIAIAANFTAEPLEPALAFWMDELRVRSRIEFAPFDQIFQQLFDRDSLLGRNSDGFNIVVVQWRDGHPHGAQTRELAAAIRSAASRGVAPIILCVCPPADSAEEAVLAAELAGQSGVHTLFPAEILSRYPVEHYLDRYADEVGAIPYTPAMFVALASAIARKIHSLESPPFKVIALDCDNTLWKGVCGEDGPLGVQVDATRRALQEFMAAQRDAGMLLCLCSKNVETDVAAVFRNNTGMVLQEQDFVASRINWQPKSENLRDIARQLRLGLDSFIVVDDNPLECAEISANCPGTLVLELPADTEQFPLLLRNLWAFDHSEVTAEDRARTELYRQESAREELRSGTDDLETFLSGLELQIDIRPLRSEDLTRVSQLTQRTNQFNCTTIRRSEADITRELEAGAECLVVEVRDRFGDYGLVGVAIFRTRAEALLVDTLLMSCRALGRKVEHHILAHLGALAQSRGPERVDIMFASSAKNQPALDFLESVGAQFRQNAESGAIYRFPVPYAGAAHLHRVIIEAKPQAVAAQTVEKVVERADLVGIASRLGSVEAIGKAVQLRLQRNTATTGFVKARNATEETLAGIWAGLLQTERPGIHDDFFRLGGNSLLAVQVISRVRQAMGVEMPLRAMFEEPTLAGFARRLESVRRAAAGMVAPPLLKKPRNESVPASFAQQRLWFIDQFDPDNPIYNIPQMTRMRGPLNVEALEKSLAEIVRRHEVLRTRFESADGQPLQVVGPGSDVRLTFTDLSHLHAPDREAEVQRRAKEEAVRPFNLAQGPILRATLLRVSSDDHVLLMVLHHISGDRWSAGILAEEMEALYRAYTAGEPSPLPELSVQYADFSEWQREWLRGEVLEKQASYWRHQLQGAPALLDLPSDRPRPALMSYRGATTTRLLPKTLVDELEAYSVSEGATLFMTLLAALQTLLSRYSGQEDIVVGSPIAGRNYAEVEPLIGFFVNTLALRTDLSGNPEFRQLLARVKETTLDAYAHQDIPFEKLVEELQPERSLSYHPVFQVAFALQNAPQRPLDLAGLKLERLPLHQGTSPFDMSWFATHVAEGISLRIEYSTDLFDETTIHRAMEHFEQLLHSLLHAPRQRVALLDILPKAEADTLLVEWNETQDDYAEHSCIHQLFESHAARAPHATAVVFGSSPQQEELTYDALNRKSNQLAHYLRERGVGPDTLVGIYLERSAAMIVAILGVLKAGGAYVPLDPEYPNERIAFMLSDASVSVLLTDGAQPGTGLQQGTAVVDLRTDWPEISSRPDSKPAALAGPANLAYVIYTSGSTGRPKGVLLAHCGLCNVAQAQITSFDVGPGSRVLQFASASFDASVFEVFMALASGATLCMGSRDELLPGPDLLQFLRQREISIVTLPPSALAHLPFENVPSLRTITVAGEACPAELVERWAPRHRFFNLYGPTEGTIWTTMAECLPGRKVSIGKPIPNTRIYILDAQLQPAPIGIPGELHIAGVGVARGYLNRPELTAERFISDVFSAVPGARLYKTGDLARFLPDGNIEYLGRVDSQIKLRGFRIEPGEIESVLLRHASVGECAVMVREDSPGDRRLVAYVTAKDETQLSAAELRAELQSHLPEYMVPAAIVQLTALPLTPNGKVDKKALPAPEYAGDRSAYEAPQTATQEIIASIWADVLKLDRVGIRDNFFELGGHSLLAMQVVARIRRILELELPVRDLFEAPTIGGLAERAETLQKQQIGLRIPTLKPASQSGPAPLSFAQQRLWFIDQLEPGNPLYNVVKIARFKGPLDVGSLERAINEIVRRHHVLRTYFALSGGEPVQIVAPEWKLALPVTDISHFSQADSKQEYERLAREATRAPFDLSKGPLFRPSLLRLAADDHVFVVAMHHIVMERWSQGVLWTELGKLYEAFRENQPSPLPELAIQYADYAVWQRDWLRGDALDKQVDYWWQELAGAPPVLELPTDRPRPAVPSHSGAVKAQELPPELLAAVHALARREGATLFMVLLGAFQSLLSLYSGQTDIVIGIQSAGRIDPELEPLIGFFVNALAIRADLSGDPDFRELLARVRKVALNAYAHQDIPFEKLVEELNPERSLSYNPIFQVSMVHDQVIDALQLSGLEVEEPPFHPGTSIFDICCYVIEKSDGVRLVVEYDSGLFDGSTIERMMGHYLTLLTRVTQRPDTRLSQISVLDDKEREQILVHWNNTFHDYPRHLSLQQLFEQQAERTPNATALEFQSAKLSYSELNARANRLANRLRKLGVGRDSTVAICLDRSIEMVVGLMGILKAGGAYVPLDPDYPKARLEVMLQDCNPKVLLTIEHLRHIAPASSIPEICLDRDWQDVESEPDINPPHWNQPEDLAYVIYTSGSTGKPKGVPNIHSAIVNRLLWMQSEYGLNESDKVLQKTPYSFDVSVWEFFWPLITGARLVIAIPGGHKDPEYLVDLIVDRGITTMHFVPSMLAIFLEHSTVERCTSLRRVVCSGEALQSEMQARFFERLEAELHNLYGPTEAAVDVTYWRCRPDSPYSFVPIGKPIWNTQIYILDPHLRPVPTGVAGELHIGGAGLARGYLRQPELTAKRFIPDPFSEVPGARIYTTGDSTRFLPDGNIQYLGRIDDQVKIRGFRVELGEIEAVIGQDPSVQECVVIAREDTPGDKKLVAYLVVREQRSVTAAKLRTLVSAQLPEYMVPSAFVTVPALPLTSSGKVNRKALPAPEYEREDNARVAPRTMAEEVIAGIWTEVLRTQQVGTTDNFFEVGGHSLSATQVVARARTAFGIEVPLRAIFEAPTIAGFAQTIEELQRTKEGLLSPPIVPLPRGGQLPLSFAQQRLWFLYEMEPESSLYNVPWAGRLTGHVDAAALEQALNGIAQRHEILRTTYSVDRDLPVQLVQPLTRIELQLRDLTSVPASDRESEARRIIGQEYAKPFRLDRDLLFRTMLLKLADDDHVLFVNTHHIASDGWSTDVMLSDLSALYEAELSGKASPLPDLPIQYSDYAAWQRNWLSGDALDRQIAYWKERLSGAPPVLSIPTDYPRPAVQSFRGETHRANISAELLEGINRIGRENGVTLFMTSLAAFQTLMLHYTKSPDIVVGTDLAGRTKAETEGLIGFFVNLLVVRTDLGHDPTFSELLARVREATLGAYAHQDVPFDKLVEELQPERALNRNPLVQVLFVHQSSAAGNRSLGGIEVGPFPLEGPSKFDLGVFCRNSTSGMNGSWVYNPFLFAPATVARIAGQYETILATAVANPKLKISEILEVLAQEEQQRRIANQKEFEDASLQKLKGIRRRTGERHSPA